MSKAVGMFLVAAIAAVAGLGAFALGDSRAVSGPVAVYPPAGTPVASPRTQISFRGAAPGELGTVTVAGSKTGSHTGALRAHSDGGGASFVPVHPFAPGETVTVRAGVPLVGASNGAVTFSIARFPVAHGHPTLLVDPGGHPHGEQHFRSRPDLRAPSLRVLARTPGAAPGDIFVGAKAGPGADGPAIYDGSGRLVWFQPMPHHTSAFDFRVQQYRGRPVLTWWQGKAVFPGEGIGAGMVYDSSYRRIATVRAGNGYAADLHEFTLTPQGTALVVAYRPVLFGKGVVIDNVVQEVDVGTGLVEREWHSLGHVPVQYAVVKPVPKVPFDAFHANSVEQEPGGNWLISSRNTDAAYEVDPATGNVVGILGGRHSTFKMGPGAQFIGQHDVRRAPDGDVTVFDNGTAGIKVGRPSRALELAVDPVAKTARVVHAFVHRSPVERTFSQGSVRTLPNGDLFVGWGGANPYMTEFSPSGAVVFDARFDPTGDDTYRAFKIPWGGATPAQPPAVAAATSHGRTTAWASWNGATEVASWQVLGGTQANALKPAGTATRTGFETAIHVTGDPTLVQVSALDSSGKVLATSPATHVGGR
jgi:hypothetical protein